MTLWSSVDVPPIVLSLAETMLIPLPKLPVLSGVPFLTMPFLEGAGDELLDEIRGAVDESLSHSAEEEIREISLLQDHLHDDIARFVYERLRRRPMVLPVVVEV